MIERIEVCGTRYGKEVEICIKPDLGCKNEDDAEKLFDILIKRVPAWTFVRLKELMLAWED